MLNLLNILKTIGWCLSALFCMSLVPQEKLVPDVYAVGQILVSGGGGYAVLWKNGESQRLSDTQSQANSVYVSGSDVYVAGYNNHKATLWKNDVSQSLGEGWASSVFAFDNDVYVGGHESIRETDTACATIWKNGVPQRLCDTNSFVKAVFVK